MEDSAFGSVSNNALQSEEVESQQTIPCLQADKPNCAPTESETSEFLAGNMSIQVILPDNPHPQSTESWSTEELQQILKLFGLRAFRPNNLLEPDDNLPLAQASVPCDPVNHPISWDKFQSIKNRPLFKGKIVDATCFVTEDSAFQTTDVITLTVQGHMRVIVLPSITEVHEAERIEVPTAYGEVEFIKTRSDGAIIEAHPPAPPLSGETPLLTTAEPARIWINAVMNEIEVNNTKKYFDPNPDNFIEQIKKYADDIRKRDGTDWAFVVFIVDASNDEDGLFADGVGAWSELGGPFMVLSNRLGGYGFDNFDKIFLHEFLHQFYALDEYQGSFFDQNGISGYLGIRNENHENATGGPFTGNPSIMKRLQLVLSPNDFITDSQPACSALPCEVLVNGNRIGATMDVTPPPSCQAARALARACFKVDWHNDQNFNGPAPFFWFHSITVDPQGPLKPGETYRFGRYYLVNPDGMPFPAGRAAIEVYTDNGTLIASRDLHRTTQFDMNNAIFEFQSVEFTIPNGTKRIDIFFARCFADPNQSCKIVAYDDFTLIADWVFRYEIDEFAAKMLGFNDEDGDVLIDPIDTTPDLKIDPEFVRRITLTLDVDISSSGPNPCVFEFPPASGRTFAFIGNWGTNQAARVVDTRGECGRVVDIDLIGPDPVVTINVERLSAAAGCVQNCNNFDESQVQSKDIQGYYVVDDAEEDDPVLSALLLNPSPSVQSPTPAFLLVEAKQGSTFDLPVVVFPADLTRREDGLTPFKLIYALDYSLGTPISGYSFDVPRENMNPIGSGNSVTINDITNVQYCIHSGNACNWLDANAVDGAFDEAGENFNFIPSLSPGLHTISIRGNNTVGNISNLFTTNLLILPNECIGKDFANVKVGTGQNDVLIGTAGRDLILGLEGNDEIRGKRGADCLLGGDGNDIIYGNKGADVMVGDEGDDTLLGGLGNDKLDGGDDFDTCKGGAGTNTKNNCEA